MIYSIHHSGFCYANQKFVERGLPSKNTKHFALWVLLKENDGYTLFDTGYANRVYDYTQKYPEKLYNQMTEIHVEKHENAIEIIKEKNIHQSDIKRIIISHFHGDHIGGLKDFPNAEFWCMEKAYIHFKRFPKVLAITKGYLKQLLPDDFENRVKFIESNLEEVNTSFRKSWKWKFSNIQIHYLPGHARGQVGIQLMDENIFFVADAAWTTNNITQKKLPHPAVRLLVDDWFALKESLNKLYDFHQNNPKVELIPTHCHQVAKKYFYGTV